MNTNNIYNTLIARFPTWKGVALCAVCCILCSLTSCHTSKTATKTGSRVRAEQQLAQRVIAAQPTFQTAEASKVRVAINYAGQKMNVSGSIAVITDSILVLSVQPLLGIEMFRVEMTPQDIVVVDKMNRRYVQLTYAELGTMTGLPLTFTDLQAVFLNRMFVVGKTQSEIEQLPYIHITGEAGHRTLIVDNKDLTYQFEIVIANDALTRTHVQLGAATAQVEYLNHQLHEGVHFPTTLLFRVDDGHNHITECELTLLNVHFNQEVRIRRADLSRYAPTTINKLFSK